MKINKVTETSKTVIIDATLDINIKAKKAAIYTASVTMMVMSMGFYLNYVAGAGRTTLLLWLLSAPIITFTFFNQAYHLTFLLHSIKKDKLQVAKNSGQELSKLNEPDNPLN